MDSKEFAGAMAEKPKWDFARVGNAIASAAAFVRFKTRNYARRIMFSRWSGAKEDEAPGIVGVKPGYRKRRRKAVIAASARCGHTRKRRRARYDAPALVEKTYDKDFKGRAWARRVNL